ncbi:MULTISPECIES: DUF2726 domain-containing protein [unclassified Burkholderia]|uniref:DUF2726 domain-containing protein n=1 Tax=unclassified Burkholderia TaxID=2613784 RepID=UPI002AB20A9E|nr:MULTISPECIES: DUF2726 domain-containing protein [unclassified Burkholderia]
MHFPRVALFIAVIAFGYLFAVAINRGSLPRRGRRQINPRDFQRQAIMTAAELKFFRQLVATLPDVWVFPQVAFAAVLKPTTKGREYWRAFGKISQKRIDFVLYGYEMNLIAVIELDDSSHDRKTEDDRKRDALLKHAGIRTLRFDVRRWPSNEAIRSAVYPAAAPVELMAPGLRR